MNESSNRTKQRLQVYVQNGHIRVDSYILLSEAAIMAITAILLFVRRLNDAFLIGMTQTLLVLAAVGTISIAVYRSSTSKNHLLDARSVAISASLSSLSYSLLAAMFLSEGQMSLFVVLSMCTSILAIVVLGLVVLPAKDGEDNKENVTAPSNRPSAQGKQVMHELPSAKQYQGNQQNTPSGPPALQLPSPQQRQKYSPQLYPPFIQPQVSQFEHINYSKSGQLDILSWENPSALSPLFEDDPLYAIPRPKRARLFLQIKSNDISVNGEDACAISSDETRFALCDGVSSSSFSRPWATLLAQQWVAHPLFEYDVEAVEQWLYEPRQQWKEWILTTWLPAINKRNQNLGQVTFSREDAEKFIAMGAASTFLGVSIDRDAGRWFAIAIGDTCLFRLSLSDHNVDCFPLNALADFTDAPASISSSTRTSSASLAKNIRYIEASYKDGDILLIATDALAAWFFRQIERGKKQRLYDMLQFSQPEDFAGFVDQQRVAKQMNDDDTTLLIIQLPTSNR